MLMTKISLVVALLFFGSFLLNGQPVNDDCDGVIDLGMVPLCSDPGEFSNETATASVIASMNNAPGCFNGGQVDRDVWFSFTLPSNISDVTIIVEGDASNGSSILNPQVALYRGLCEFDRLNLLACKSSSLGSSKLRLDMVGLVPSATYFLRINDYSINTTPNAGDFQICVSELLTIYNIGEGIDRSESCSGTLYDSGGPDSVYQNNEDYTFSICPSEFHRCIRLNLETIALESNFDFLRIYEGEGISGTLLAQTSAVEDLADFFVSATGCITVQFQSEGSGMNDGFEITWECLLDECEGTSLDNPDVVLIPGMNSGSTCDDFSDIAEDYCAPEGDFIGGPDYVYSYIPDNEICISLELTASLEGTGLMILSQNEDGSLECESVSPSGFIESIELDSGLVYYFVIANAAGCFDFTLEIKESQLCNLVPTLENALCHPINSCFQTDSDSLRQRFVFSSSILADIEIIEGINSGCWVQDIIPPDLVDNTNFYWFTLRAYNDGNIGFFVESVIPSDIDFNVWGPFSDEWTCEFPDSVRNYIIQNQPIRSSWTGGTDPTGLADIHPVTGVPVFEEYDCDFPLTGAEGDGIVRTIQALEGENYVFLFNDFGGEVDERGLIVDWSGMDENTIFPDQGESRMSIDTTLCPNEVLDLAFLNSEYPITILPNIGLSCNDCFDPVITPSSNFSQYMIFPGGACFVDTIDLTILVLEDFGTDTIFSCNDQVIDLDVQVPGLGVEYQWVGDRISCLDCPNPIFQSSEAGEYVLNYSVTIDGCTANGSYVIFVNENTGPNYEIISDTMVCLGSEINIGGLDFSGTIYKWSLNGNVISTDANPQITVDSSIVMVLEVSNADCPYTIVDSVSVTAIELPLIETISAIDACEGDTIKVSLLPDEADVTYEWISTNEPLSPNSANSSFVVSRSENIILRARRGECVVMDTTVLTVTPIGVQINPNLDTLFLCLNDSFDISSSFRPSTADPIWIRFDSGDTLTSSKISGQAKNSFLLYRELESGGCFARDTMYVQVDSLPEDLSIQPVDTTVCEGSTVLLESPVFNTARYNMDYLWTPTDFFQTGDSLYNAVVQPTDTITYARISTSGACIDTAEVTIFVNKIPEITLIPESDTICEGQEVMITAIVDPEDVDLMWMGSNMSCNDCLDPVVSPTGTTTYTLEANNDGCPSSASVTITVDENKTPEFDIPEDRVICEGDFIALNQNENPDFQYLWKSTDPNFMDQNTRNPIVSPPVGYTTYSVTVTGDAAFCNTREASFSVLVPQLAELQDIPYCNGTDLVDLQVALVDAPNELLEPEDVLWSNGERGTSISVRPDDIIEGGLTATLDLDDCISSVSMNFIQLDLNIDLSSSIDTGSSIFVSTATNHELSIMLDDLDEIKSIQWINRQTGEEIGTGENIRIVHDDAENSEYLVQVMTVNGCMTSIIFRYDIIDFRLPNAFSPNGDGVNDYFNIIAENLEDSPFEITEFKIFSRWGSLVYDNETPILGWDGTDGSNPFPTDSYRYIIKVRTGETILEKQGEINLIR